MSTSSPFVAAAKHAFRELHGVVVSSGLMQNTVKVRVGGRVWNNRIQKYFNTPRSYLVHDPRSSLRTGDVVAITPGWRTSKHKRHVVKHIIAPYGTPLEERPPVPSDEERVATREEKRQAKLQRRAERRAVQQEEVRQEAARKKARHARPEETQQQNPAVVTSIEDVD